MKHRATRQNNAPGRSLARTATGRKIDGQRDRERGVNPPRFLCAGIPSRVHYATKYKPGFRGSQRKVVARGSSPVASRKVSGHKYLLRRALRRAAAVRLRARFSYFAETKVAGEAR